MPYLYAQTPSPTSEFAHPDVRLAFTLLQYYQMGLPQAQFHRVLAHMYRDFNGAAGKKKQGQQGQEQEGEGGATALTYVYKGKFRRRFTLVYSGLPRRLFSPRRNPVR